MITIQIKIILVFLQTTSEADARWQVEEHHGPDNGADGKVRQQSRRRGQRTHAAPVRGEEKDRGPVASHAARNSGGKFDARPRRRAGFLSLGESIIIVSEEI